MTDSATTPEAALVSAVYSTSLEGDMGINLLTAPRASGWDVVKKRLVWPASAEALLADADEMEGWGAGNEAARVRGAVAKLAALRRVADALEEIMLVVDTCELIDASMGERFRSSRQASLARAALNDLDALDATPGQQVRR